MANVNEVTGSLDFFKGEKGDPGKSAYEVAVDNGFEGTEEEWLESLKGEGDLSDRIAKGAGDGAIIAGLISGENANTADGNYAYAQGIGNTATGAVSRAEGQLNQATGVLSHAEGSQTTASGAISHAEGQRTVASGDNSHAEGLETTASANAAHVEGAQTFASGGYSHAEGHVTVASGNSAHAEGDSTIASGSYSHAEGSYGYAYGKSSHAEGGGGNKSNISLSLTGNGGATTYSYTGSGISYMRVDNYYKTDDTIVIVASKDTTNHTITFDHSLSETAITNKSYTFAQLNVAIATDAHAEGTNTIASGDSSHAEGNGTIASGIASHAEGYETDASGYYSHAEGYGTTASGQYSHAEGSVTTAFGYNSHAEGYGTIATGKSQHVFGENNIEDPNSNAYSRATYVEIVGNGSNQNNRSNARTLDWNGNEVLAGKLTVGAAPTNDMDVATKKYVDDNSGGGGFPLSDRMAKGEADYAVIEGLIEDYNDDSSYEPTTYYKNEANGFCSHAEGCNTVADAHSTHAEGCLSIASAFSSHAEGSRTLASGFSSHAEGVSSRSTSDATHAEGDTTTASGFASHSEGRQSQAVGKYSHAEGNGTIANGEAQHVFGAYNIAETVPYMQTGQYLEIVGNGTSSARSNARTLDRSGNEKIAGALTLGMGTADEITITAAQLQALLALLQ